MYMHTTVSKCPANLGEARCKSTAPFLPAHSIMIMIIMLCDHRAQGRKQQCHSMPDLVPMPSFMALALPFANESPGKAPLLITLDGTAPHCLT